MRQLCGHLALILAVSYMLNGVKIRENISSVIASRNINIHWPILISPGMTFSAAVASRNNAVQIVRPMPGKGAMLPCSTKDQFALAPARRACLDEC
ncbi:hypothetical protein [Aminobacter sp. HY435]|uniref:hypothetical protein n=1 Tax=Aminobacter sp. HY435 TaxID=2970917 RepID=UPI0022B95CE9|nr:hypothetical protein [Aminobacter sp. HY435]